MAIRVKVLYFAQAREAAGTGKEEVSLSEGSRVSDLVAASGKAHPGLQAMSRVVRLAVNEEVSGEGRVLEEGDTVAFLPPVAGG
ncbi:MAG: molybdopterin converting factor subunit 1 [Nitrososphaerota archaeon]|nr:molybdopterin converting factor subunit 1 [Nitrososphaerota archaeon]